MSVEIINKLLNGELPRDFGWNNQPHPNIRIYKSIPAEPTPAQALKTEVLSECLRDGLHGVKDYPTSSQMLEYVAALEELGINTMTVGIYPGEKNKVDTTIKTLLRLMRDQHPNLIPNVLCLATEGSLKWLGECKLINPKLNAVVFMGTAPSRLLVEEWSQNFVLKQLAWAVETATIKHEVDVIGATEHTTQTPPEFLRKIIQTQVEHGAKYFCIADTIGIARPLGTFRIVKYVKKVLNEIGANNVKVDWHGHQDKENSLSNALTAISAGADRVHVVARGRGERAGNTSLEGILINLTDVLNEANIQSPWRMEKISSILSLYDTITNMTAPSHGLLASRSHTTSLGIHTAAIIKAKALAAEAKELGHLDLAKDLDSMARQIYSAIDPHLVGKDHTITISPWSGTSTVKLAYLAIGGHIDDLRTEVIEKVLDTAKGLGRELTLDEFIKLTNNHKH